MIRDKGRLPGVEVLGRYWVELFAALPLTSPCPALKQLSQPKGFLRERGQEHYAGQKGTRCRGLRTEPAPAGHHRQATCALCFHMLGFGKKDVSSERIYIGYRWGRWAGKKRAGQI